tara:strand:+ start:130 stop:798 length:669 start_codon:yes stop_codon:yes gene_type:complete
MATVDAYGTPIGGQTRNPFNYVKVEQLARDNTTAWLTQTEVTNQLNLFGDTSQDTYLAAIELATRQAIEDYLGLSIFATTYRVWYGTESLVASPVCFDLPEVSQNSNSALSGVTISFVKYYNDAFPPVVTTISNTEYFYDNSGNKVIVSSMPTSVNTVMTAPIYIDYVTAANPMAAYPVIKQAGLLLLTHLYNNRSNTTDIQLKDIPFGVANLLRPYKPLVM